MNSISIINPLEDGTTDSTPHGSRESLKDYSHEKGPARRHRGFKPAAKLKLNVKSTQNDNFNKHAVIPGQLNEDTELNENINKHKNIDLGMIAISTMNTDSAPSIGHQTSEKTVLHRVVSVEQLSSNALSPEQNNDVHSTQ